MKKIVLLPLDERPCNAKFPVALFAGSEFQVICPPSLGQKKQPADCEAMAQFLLDACADADGLVLSMDMLLYGGLLPSRLHCLSQETLAQRLHFLRRLRQQNPKMTVYAFQCIMRCPTYSSADEEPEYYGLYGAQIHQLGIMRHKQQLGQPSPQLESLENSIPVEVLEDYLSRRQKNLEWNIKTLDLVDDGTIDFLVVPQDDAAPLGFTALDQAQVRLAIREKRLQQKVLVYPGADELGMTLLARMCNSMLERCPAVYPLYASVQAPFIVPSFEDRPLGETTKYQIMATGCRMAAAPEMADLILAITAPPSNMVGSAVQPRLDPDYDVGRSLSPFFQELCYWLDQKKPVTICDNAYGNGGDLELLSLLDSSGRLMQVSGYSGWNTSSNTMGTALAQGVRFLHGGADAAFLDFLVLRYVEDCGYDVLVRQSVTAQKLPAMGLNYFNVQDPEGLAAEQVALELVAFIQAYMPSQAKHIQLVRTRLPWQRMFEPDLEVRYVP